MVKYGYKAMVKGGKTMLAILAMLSDVVYFIKKFFEDAFGKVAG